MAKTRKKASPRQQEILNIIKQEPGITAGEIAKRLQPKTSAGAVYQQISRLRSAGLLPKAARGPAPKLRSAAEAVAEPTKVPASTNGHLTVEQHVAEELVGVGARIREIEEERARIQKETEERVNLLTEEESVLARREGVLEQANKVLIEA